jgi:FdhE protein
VVDFSSLRAEWDDLLARRRAFREPLAFFTLILDGWARWVPESLRPLSWGPDECRDRWERGLPLIAEAPPSLTHEALEGLLGPTMEQLAESRPEAAESLQRFAVAWDQHEIGPSALFPGGDEKTAAHLQDRAGLGIHLIGFLAHVALRPAFQAYFEGVRSLPDGIWKRGVCPWCGGSPAYSDLIEDGRRRLSCHLCGDAWIAPRLKCPFCDNWEARDMVRLVAEEAEEGYFIEGCRVCRGYLKGVDRRQRWNAASPLLEDWGSPHLDLIAHRQGYWRATPSLIHLFPPESLG